jgi:molybdopterin molybdotransferase
MIQPKAAQQRVAERIGPLPPTNIPLTDAAGAVLGADVAAPVDLPLFDMSAMDGYAIAFSPGSPDQVQQFECVGEIKAGDTQWPLLVTGQCLRIFTGALVPKEATTVVMQEKTVVNGKFIQVQATDLNPGNNIRYRSSQITTGTVAFKAGTLLTPGAIGALASMGIDTVSVIRLPVVSILVTGSELKPAGATLLPGEIYESNLKTLQAALRQCGVVATQTVIVDDDETQIVSQLESMLPGSDLILLSGGISVGDYDFAGTALRRLGVTEIFYKVSQKPGKPLFFGQLGNTYVFALPGNPGSVLTCFYEYVWPAIRRMCGHRDIFLPIRYLPIKGGYINKGDRALFLKSRIENDQLEVLDKQGSDMLVSFAHADALAFIPEFCTVAEGEPVETHLLPHIR